MLSVVGLLVGSAVAAAQIDASLPIRDQFAQWQKVYGVEYDVEEAEMRFSLFEARAARIHAHNKLYEAGKSTYAMGLNRFAASNDDERRAVRGYKAPAGKSAPAVDSQFPGAPQDLPQHMDWKAAGRVTYVKDQGQCGSCWAFSAVGAIEVAAAIATNQSWGKTSHTGLSEMQVVNCDTVDLGCNGGDMSSAFNYTMGAGGLTAEEAYPYSDFDGKCQDGAIVNKVSTITGYVDVMPKNTTALMEAVTLGAVSVAIDASCDEFMDYTFGVFNGGMCGTSLDHGVLVVGYDFNDKGSGYWLVKNSWGGGWGDQGYIKMYVSQKNPIESGTCGINLQPSYPLGATMPAPYTPVHSCGESSSDHTYVSCQPDQGCCCQESGVLNCKQWVCCESTQTCTKGTGCSAPNPFTETL